MKAKILAVLLLTSLAALSQTLTTLRKFSSGSDGANPYGELVTDGNVLYGTTLKGNSSGNGTVFKLNLDGSNYQKLYGFSASSSAYPNAVNNDGAYPFAGLVLAGNTLYGTTYTGGVTGNGTVFSINTNGGSFINLKTFAPFFGPINGEGANPSGGLAISGNMLYGTTQHGGPFGNGVVFRIGTDGTGFQLLHSFTSLGGPNSTNADGARPSCTLAISGNTAYGATFGGGFQNLGVLFKINLDGSGFANIHNFNGTDGYSPNHVMISGNVIYGATVAGGVMNGSGTLFRLNPDGSGFVSIYKFSPRDINTQTNRDGAFPEGLILSGNTLYGTCNAGGNNSGTVFSVNTNGTAFTNLHSMVRQLNEGDYPEAKVILVGASLYGTASAGGLSPGYGTVFRLSLPQPPAPPQLRITPNGNNVIITWPTNQPEFELQACPLVVSTATWVKVSPDPIIVNGSNAVLVPISGPKQFYRLSRD